MRIEFLDALRVISRRQLRPHPCGHRAELRLARRNVPHRRQHLVRTITRDQRSQRLLHRLQGCANPHRQTASQSPLQASSRRGHQHLPLKLPSSRPSTSFRLLFAEATTRPSPAQHQSCAKISINYALRRQARSAFRVRVPISAAWFASSSFYLALISIRLRSSVVILNLPHLSTPKPPTPSHPPPIFAIHEPWPTTS